MTHPAQSTPADGSASDLSPRYVRLLHRLVRPFPDFDFAFIKPVRRKAAALLQVRPGDRVLDVGCGLGASFPYLIEAVGAAGEVTGVEISAAAAAQAQRRIARNRWTNVQVVVAPAQRVALTGKYDALLMFAAPDVFASEAALDNLFPHLRSGARVVFFGAKASSRRFGWLLNSALYLATAKFSLPTTPRLEAQPWRLVAARVRDLEVEEYFHGWMFLASGTLHGDDSEQSPDRR